MTRRTGGSPGPDTNDVGGAGVRQPSPQRIDLLVVNASELLVCAPPSSQGRGVRGGDLDVLPVLVDGAVAVHDGRVLAVGDSARLARRYVADTVVDAQSRLVSPGLIDAHTHLVHAGSRHEEWERRLRGLPLDPRTSGIQATISATRDASSESLRASLVERLDTMLEHGTTTCEVKSGYGITVEHERRLLEIIASVRHAVDIVPTYLGAHTIPPELRSDRAAALALVIDQIPVLAHLAEYVDVCCEPGGYTPDEVRVIASVAADHGLRTRIHADHAGHVGGTEVAVDIGASSVDHLEHASGTSLGALSASDTAAILFPAVSLHLRHLVPTVSATGTCPARHPDLGAHFRRIAECGAVVALATDYNPGSAPTLSMQVVMQLAARLYGFTAAQIWYMCTVNAAVSLDREHAVGSLEVGKAADLVVWSVPHHEMVINRFGANLVHTVIKDGRVAWQAPASGALWSTTPSPSAGGRRHA